MRMEADNISQRQTSAVRSTRRKLAKLARILGCYVVAGTLAACSTGGGNSPPGAASNGTGAPAPSVANTAVDDGRLQKLLDQRVNGKSASDYALGPGDVLEVSVQDVPELHECRVRISGDNTVSMPILGTIDVAGLNEEGIKQRIYNRASRYVHDPEVEVFVREYHSRDVMVMGMVQKPGMYALDTPNETVLDVIGKAGGSTERAASQVILIPSGATTYTAQESTNQSVSHDGTFSEAKFASTENPAPSAVSQAAPDQPVRPVAAHMLDQPNVSPSATTSRSRWIVLDTSGSGDPALMMLPARPGDLIMIPAAGEVMVQGWVRNPGAFVITPRMTALGAVTAAGGEMFSSSADLLRAGNDTDQADYRLNLNRINKHQEQDVLVQSGDVIIVNKSATGAVPYLVYSLFNKLSSGIYATPF